MKQSLHRLLKDVFVFSPARRTGGGERAGGEGRGAAAPFHSGGAHRSAGAPLTAARHHGAREEKGERPSERSGPPATLVRRDSILRARHGRRRRRSPLPAAARPLSSPPQAAPRMRGQGRATGCACARRGVWGGVSRGRLKMAAPGATFRLLLPFRPVAAAAAAALRSYGVRASGTGELITHTGQVYEEKDYRRVRFVGRQKEVNKNFAIDLIAEQPVSEVESRVISCDGGGGALGHPKVYINLDKDTKTGTCGYCGLQFKQKHH